MAVVLFALALAVAGWSGLGLTLLLWGRAPRRLPGLGELSCYSFLLGTANVAVTMQVTGWVTSAVPALTVIESAALGAFGVVARRATLVALVRRRPTRRDCWWAAATVGSIALMGSVVLWFSLHTSLEWDGLTVWFMKAQLAATHHGRIPLAYYSDATREWSAPNHPVYLPLLSSWIFGWMGHTSEYAIKALFPLHLVASAGLLAGTATRITGRRALGVLAPLLLLATPALVHGPGSAASGYADVSMAAFYLATVVAGIEVLRNDGGAGATHARRLFATLGVVLPLVKMEGAMQYGVVLLVVSRVLVVRGGRAGAARRATARSVLLLAAPFLVTVACWRLLLSSRHVAATGDMLPVTPSNLISQLDRTGVLLSSLARELTNWDRWSVLWVWCAVAMAWWLVTRRGHQRLLLPLLIVVPMALDVGVFYFSSWSPVEAHVDSTLFRLLIHITPVAVLLVVLSFPALTARPHGMAAAEVSSPG